MNQIEQTIFHQINTALDADVFVNHIDNQTGLIAGTVPKMIQNLYNTYGMIKQQVLAKEKSNLGALTYNHSLPITSSFVSIDEYANMAEPSGAGHTPDQLINFGILILTHANIFASNIRRWYARLNS